MANISPSGRTLNLTHLLRGKRGFPDPDLFLGGFFTQPKIAVKERFDHSLILQNLPELVSCVMRITA